MSADNWTLCPKCGGPERKTDEERAAEVEAAYGKVSPKEYLEMARALERPYVPEYTLREDYEIGIYEGEFFIRYRGHCQKCDFSYRYDYNDKNPLEQATQ